MIPSYFNGANDVMGGPAGTTEDQVGSLVIHRGTDKQNAAWPVMTSCWTPSSPEEREEFIRTGKLYLMIYGQGHPVVCITAYNPVEQEWVMNGKPLQPNHPLLRQS
jgi:hypothetical protein